MDIKKFILPTGLFLIGTALFIHFKKQVDMLRDFCFTVQGYKVLRIGLQNMSLRLMLSIKNNSDLDINIEGYDLKISLNGRRISDLKSGNNQLLQANSKSIINLDFDFNPKETISNAIKFDVLKGAILDPNAVTVGVIGNISVSHAGIIKISKIPIDFSKTLSDMMPKQGQQSQPCL